MAANSDLSSFFGSPSEMTSDSTRESVYCERPVALIPVPDGANCCPDESEWAALGGSLGLVALMGPSRTLRVTHATRWNLVAEEFLPTARPTAPCHDPVYDNNCRPYRHLWAARKGSLTVPVIGGGHP
jgi:hypothetical protein